MGIQFVILGLGLVNTACGGSDIRDKAALLAEDDGDRVRMTLAFTSGSTTVSLVVGSAGSEAHAEALARNLADRLP